ncbi:MAG: glycine cleavage system aminomethyltransferase GcvT [Deltaproteobacteria bacterium]|nr:glycine cleavage system aminomethyltransferase GcvT [Deltaproteobacteria bacterium]
MRRTPLYEDHVAAGARMVEFAGWQMPVQYNSIVAEHHAVRRAAGLFDVSHMGEVELTGPGAEAACARLFANDARSLAVGRAQYSMIANPRGGLIDDIIVYRLGAERFLVCVNASNAAADLAWIREHESGSCTITDRSDATALIAIQGPEAVAIVAMLAPAAQALVRFGVGELQIAGVRALAARTGYTGEDGFELFVDAGAATTVWRTLLERGGERGLIPCGLGARDTLRLEAALPLYGHELGPDTSPFEARIGWAVKLNRPDMIGYQALSAAAAGAVRRKLVGFFVEGGIAREGAPVFAAGSAAGDAAERAVGNVTSGSHSPTLGRAVAMALIEIDAGAGPFEIEVRGKRRSAVVTNLPFYVKRA